MLDFDAASTSKLVISEGGERMEYGIREVAELAGVSARTLRYYDEIGLLKPSHVNEAGYRFYGERELEFLQQILFYRERGFELKQIQKVLYQKDFDLLHALEEHLSELEKQQMHTEALIRTVRQTIASKKGEIKMSQQEKFEAFKKEQIQKNEETYGAEIRGKYGDTEVDASNRKMLNMSEKEWEDFQKLEEEIRRKLETGVRTGMLPDSEEAKEIVQLHKAWLCKTWTKYTLEAHKGVAAMYVMDERFQQYYDREVPGCAELLKQAVEYWAERI